MEQKTQEALDRVYKVREQCRTYVHAAGIIQFDKETVCPPAAMAEQGEVASLLDNKAYALTKEQSYIDDMNYLYEHREELDVWDQENVELFHRDFEKEKNITPEIQLQMSKVYNDGFVDWLNAKQQSDYRIFRPTLEKIRDVELQRYHLSEKKFDTCYDFLFDNYEAGVTTGDLDRAFGAFKDRCLPLLHRIQKSKKKIRTDFLSRPVPRYKQEMLSDRLMDVLGMDRQRSALTTSEHPFTDGYSYNDVRITTHYYENAFISSMYSVIHEGGHALFELNQPKEAWEHYLYNKTMGQHESVSRFYENRIGRSKGFVHLIYPILRDLFKDEMADVSEQELYEALNVVESSLVRTEADEFTYTFHIILRYEIEREIVNNHLDLDRLPGIWNAKYREYLGIEPANDREGVLQDMHWSGGFGYFPTYALGNMYNAMYYNRMAQDMDIENTVAAGGMDKVLDWMKIHVFAKADLLDPKPWIRDITGRDFTPDDFLDYLEKKYTELYEL